VELVARNPIKGKVVDLRKDAVAAQVQADVGGGNVVTSTITADFAERLGLAAGAEPSQGPPYLLAFGKNSCCPSSW
jgi:molybdopterin-binding protein